MKSSPVWDTSCLVELTYDLINRRFLCGMCTKPGTIQYFHSDCCAHVLVYCCNIGLSLTGGMGMCSHALERLTLLYPYITLL